MRPDEFVKKISLAIALALKQAYDNGYKRGYEDALKKTSEVKPKK